MLRFNFRLPITKQFSYFLFSSLYHLHSSTFRKLLLILFTAFQKIWCARTLSKRNEVPKRNPLLRLEVYTFSYFHASFTLVSFFPLTVFPRPFSRSPPPPPFPYLILLRWSTVASCLSFNHWWWGKFSYLDISLSFSFFFPSARFFGLFSSSSFSPLLSHFAFHLSFYNLSTLSLLCSLSLISRAVDGQDWGTKFWIGVPEVCKSNGSYDFRRKNASSHKFRT